MPLPSRSILFAILVIAAMTIYVAAMSKHKQSEKAHTMASPQSRVLSAPLHVSAALCGAGAGPHMPLNALNHIQVTARGLAAQKHFAEAFAQFHSIALMDPGFPGVNLDISVSLLQLKDNAGAKNAIDSQIAISDCLMRLPPESLQTYCKAEGLESKADTCSHRLQTIRQTAYYQAALVQMELGHAVAAVPSVAVAKALPASSPPPRQALSNMLLPRKAATVNAGATEAAKPTRIKLVSTIKGDPLVSGAGTDSSLGAYSK